MIKRQNIRKTIIICMFFLFPITITWLSPALPIIYALFGVLSGAAIIFTLQFLSSLFFGRAFCGYLCSGGGLQECLMRISDKKTKNANLYFVKYVVWALWLLTIIVLFIRAGGINEIDFFAGTADNWIFLIAPYRYLIYFGVVLLITVVNLLDGKRAACRIGCWMAPFMIIGAKVSDLLKLPRLRIKSNQNSCIGCKQCSKICPMSLNVMAMVETASMNNPECILCGECIDICPNNSITYSFRYK